MTFKKGHKPYPRKTQTELPESQKSDVQVATDLLEGVMLSSMNPNQSPPLQHQEMEKSVRKTLSTQPSTQPRSSIPSSDGDIQNVLPLLVRALERIAEGEQDSREAAKFALEQARKSTSTGNRNAPDISVFNPQGEREYPRPHLKCRMFLPWEAERECLTVEEIRLLNLLEEGEYRVKRNDGTRMTIMVTIKKNLNGTPDRLLLYSETGFGNLRHMQVPALSIMLRDILSQNPMTKDVEKTVPTMDEMYEMVASGALPVSTAEV